MTIYEAFVTERRRALAWEETKRSFLLPYRTWVDVSKMTPMELQRAINTQRSAIALTLTLKVRS